MKRQGWRSGFLIGGCIVLAGLFLEIAIGAVRWDVLAWPVNIICLSGFLLLLVTMALLYNKVYAIRYLSTRQAAIPAMVYAVALTVIMGLTRQEADGQWLSNMLTFWPFVLIYVFVAFILGLVILRQIRTAVANSCVPSVASEQSSSVSLFTLHSSLLSHLGLFIAIVCGTLGSPDLQRLKMVSVIGETERRAVDQEQRVVELPIAIQLDRFIMETYDDGTPRRFASEIHVLTQSGRNIQAVVDVNKPVEVEGWKIYQYGYDTRMGAQSRISIFELVSDPWLPAVYVGFFMMLAGVLLLVTYTHWSYKHLLPIGVLVVVALAIVSYLMPVIRSSHLVPALQSPWFYPHILVYIVCYSLMGVAAVIAIYALVKRPLPSHLLPLTSSIVYVGLVFMTLGMLFGALWAKEAWGHYWSWDPKETWAAITWLSYLVYVHYQQLPRHKERLALWMLIVSFFLLQMCWWGIKLLPSAQGSSVHVYT